jgi:ribosomal protein S27AE
LSTEIRNYACPYCGETLESTDDLKGHVLKAHKGRGLPAPEGRIKLTINKAEYVFQVEPNWTLYYLIHDKLGLTGSKQFCDRGACGSCTMIVDGKPVLSCMMLAIECDGKTVETVEGIAAASHPLIETYVKNHAMPQPGPVRGGDSGSPFGQPLPLQYLPAAPHRRQGSCRNNKGCKEIRAGGET